MSTSEHTPGDCGFFDDSQVYTREPLCDQGYEGHIDEDAHPPQLAIYPMGADEEELVTTWISADATSDLVITDLEDME